MSFTAKSPTVKTLRSQRRILGLAAARRLFTTPAIRPTTAHYDELVNAAGRSGDFDELRRLLSRRVKDGCYNTAKTFDFVTRTYNEPIDTLCEALAGLDRGHARKCAFDALVSRLCRIGRVDESLRAVDAMARAGCAPNALTFHPAISALARGNRIDSAWRVLDKMRGLGVAPDAPAFNFILATHCAAGDAAAAAAAAERMAGSGVKADARTYDALVMGACRAGRVEGAVALLRRMEDDGVATLLSTRLYVVDALLSLGYNDMAVRFVRVYGGRGTWLDGESLRCLASRFMKLKRTDMARLVLEEMRKRGLEMGDSLKDFLEKGPKWE